MPSSEQTPDRRSATRHRVLKAGTILIGNSSINCMVRDMSDTGAMLNVTSSVGIPDDFLLILAPDGHRAPCHVAWRKEKQIGVTFE
jgi:hypothetical protein